MAMPLAPDFLTIEIANALRAMVASARLSPPEAGEILRSLLASSPATLVRATSLLPAALEIALRLRHSVYDCLYLALAQAEHCHLVTADTRLLRAVRGTELESYVRPLVP
jgi:predicted nucleic acid-binding protein